MVHTQKLEMQQKRLLTQKWQISHAGRKSKWQISHAGRNFLLCCPFRGGSVLCIASRWLQAVVSNGSTFQHLYLLYAVYGGGGVPPCEMDLTPTVLSVADISPPPPPPSSSPHPLAPCFSFFFCSFLHWSCFLWDGRCFQFCDTPSWADFRATFTLQNYYSCLFVKFKKEQMWFSPVLVRVVLHWLVNSLCNLVLRAWLTLLYFYIYSIFLLIVSRLVP